MWFVFPFEVVITQFHIVVLLARCIIQV